MARLLTSRCKLSRRAKTDLGLIGYRTLSSKCRGRVKVPPGQHGAKAASATHMSDYGKQLSEKQKLKIIYGVLERQFKRYYTEAARRTGATSENLLKILESRLDNVVYRMGFAITRAEARQLVSHRHVLVNGKIVNLPSYEVSPEDSIEIANVAKAQLRIKSAMEASQQKESTPWVEINQQKMKGTVKTLPQLIDFPQYNLNLVVELYSK